MVGCAIECPRVEGERACLGDLGGINDLLGSSLKEDAPTPGAMGVVVIDLEGHHSTGRGGGQLRPRAGPEYDIALMHDVVHGQNDREGLDRHTDPTNVRRVQEHQAVVRWDLLELDSSADGHLPSVPNWGLGHHGRKSQIPQNPRSGRINGPKFFDRSGRTAIPSLRQAGGKGGGLGATFHTQFGQEV
jgi:hypothetical protein